MCFSVSFVLCVLYSFLQLLPLIIYSDKKLNGRFQFNYVFCGCHIQEILLSYVDYLLVCACCSVICD